SKVACEQVLKAYAAAYKFELGLLRFAGVYGYGHTLAGQASAGVCTSWSRRRWPAGLRRSGRASQTRTRWCTSKTWRGV
ncbi:MAG TPA: hypothetical protein VIR57_09010, partial [Chloroflexota bacterium]